jgi:hypothetical protein
MVGVTQPPDVSKQPAETGPLLLCPMLIAAMVPLMGDAFRTGRRQPPLGRF